MFERAPNGEVATATRSIPDRRRASPVRTLVVLLVGLLALPLAASAQRGSSSAVSLTPSALTVLYGHRVTLDGRIPNGSAGRHVAIVAHPYGRPAFRFAVVTTGPGGHFRYVANPTILTAYTARITGAASAKAVVDVRPTIVVRELGNGRVWAHVASAAFLFGRSVKLQQLTGSTWQTIAKHRLSSTASTTFTKGLVPDAKLRVAMSINQAGAGYVGSVSHPITYHGV